MGAQAGNLETKEGEVWLSVLTVWKTRTLLLQTEELGLLKPSLIAIHLGPVRTFIQAVSLKIIQALTLFLLLQMKSRILQKTGEKRKSSK